MTIAPEGRLIVGVVLAAAIVTAFVWGVMSWPLWVVALFVAQFFRDPKRNIKVSDDEVVSPADGRVVFVGRALSPADGAEMIKISVFMNVFNVHVNRSPMTGKVVRSQRFAGSFFNAALDKASEQNERHMIVIDGGHGEITCVQIVGLLARRVLCYAKEGDMLSGGERYGFIRFGSRADLYLPLNMKPAVALGDTVVAGITRVASPS